MTVLSGRSNKDDNLVLSKYFSSGVGGAKGFTYTTSGTASTLNVFGGSAIGTTIFTVQATSATSVRVGIGTNLPQYELEIVGELSATNKSFVIDHPTKPGKKLRYGSLEGPENGVYVRGELKDSNIIERRKERKENRKMNREKKRIANRKRYIYEQYVRLYQNYVQNQKWEYCCNLIAMMKKEFGSDYLSSEIFIEDEPYIISSVMHNGNYYQIKVSK